MLHRLIIQLVPYVIVLAVAAPLILFLDLYFDRAIPIDVRSYQFEVDYNVETQELVYNARWIGLREDCEWEVTDEITGRQLSFMPRASFAAVLTEGQIVNFARPAPYLPSGDYTIVPVMLFWCNDLQRAFNNPIKFIGPTADFTIPERNE